MSCNESKPSRVQSPDIESPASWWFTPGGAVPPRIKLGLAGSTIALGLLCFWCNPFFGNDTRHVVGTAPISGWSWGSGYGSKKVYLAAGQTLRLSGTVTVKEGYLAIRVYRDPILPKPVTGEAPPGKTDIRHTQTFGLSVTAKEAGFYRIHIDPWREQRKYDIDYDISWRVE